MNSNNNKRTLSNRSLPSTTNDSGKRAKPSAKSTGGGRFDADEPTPFWRVYFSTIEGTFLLHFLQLNTSLEKNLTESGSMDHW